MDILKNKKVLLSLGVLVLVAIGIGFWLIRGRNSSIFFGDSGIEGQVMLGPTCPVQKVGDDSCGDKPYSTTIQVYRTAPTDFPYFGTTTDSDGHFRITLPPDDYTVKAHGGQGERGLPFCGEQQVKVELHKFNKLDLRCDTGIR